MFGRNKPSTDPIPSTPVLGGQEQQGDQAPQVSRRNILLGVAGIGTGLFLAACSTEKPGVPAATTSAGKSGEAAGSTPPAEVLKIAQLGIATPDKLAQMDDRQTIVDEFKLKASYATSAEEVIGSYVYLHRALALSGTSADEISMHRTDSNASAFLSSAKRFNSPAIEGLTGKSYDETTASTSSLGKRHSFVALRALAINAYDPQANLELALAAGDIRIIDGSYESGVFTATFTMKLSDNLKGSKAQLNDPDITSINGTEAEKMKFTKHGDEWLQETLESNYQSAA